MNITRREMLRWSLGSSALCATGTTARGLLAAEGRGKGKKKRRSAIPIGLGLWSVRQQCEKELPAVLQAVGKMGYQAVELAHSYYGHDAAAWRKLLDENGLKSCGMHVGLPMLEGDAFDKTVEIHKAIGTPLLVVASLPKRMIASLEALRETAQKFNDLAEKLKPHGMQIGYHCHGGDFEKVEGTTPWEAIAENTHPEVVMQLDIGNCLGGGGDAIAMLRKFPGRSQSVHIKDHGGKPGAVFGEGTVDWKQVFQICETTGGTRQYVVEEEGRSGPESIQDVERALQNYRKMRG